MKKGFFSKAISFSLALVMVALMIPMGAIGVFADVADVDVTAENVVIDSVADWNAVAAVTGDTFEGQTVSLGAHISFGNEAAPVLFDTFSGTFLGNGFTVSGTAMTDQNIIANIVTGGTIDGGDGTENSNKVMTISGFTYNSTGKTTIAIVAGTLNAASAVKNVKVDGCTITADKSFSGVVVSTAVGGDFNDNKALISNCTVTNCTANFTHQSGLIVGGVSAYVTIENCSVSASSITASAAAVGAIVGKMNGGQNARISNCEVASNVTISTASAKDGYAEGVGMVVGLAGYDNKIGTSGSLSVTGCKVGGTIIAKGGDNSSWSKYHSAGGVVGALGLAGDNDISNNTVNVTITATSGKVYVGGIVGSSVSKLNISENTVNVTLNSPNNSTGGVIGYYSGQGESSITVSKCKISGSIYETEDSKGSPRIGGIIGRAVKNPTAASTGENKIEKCNVDMSIYSASKYSKLAGLVGGWGDAAMDAKLDIDDCYVDSIMAVSYLTRKDENDDGEPNPVSAGIVSEIKSNGITVDNVIVAATMTTTTFNSTDKTFATVNKNNTVMKKGAVLFNSKTNGLNAVDVHNCYTTVTASTQSGFAVVGNADMLANLIKYDSKNFIENVNDHFRCGLVQVSNAVDGNYMIRFIGTSAFNDVTSAHMTITATLGTEVRTFEADCEAYDVLTAHKSTTQIERVASEAYGAEKFVAITVNEIPAASANDIVFDIELTVVVGGVTYTVTANDMLIPPVAA